MKTPHRNSLEFNCAWAAGFQFRKGFHGRLGYLLDWSGCGGLTLKKELRLAAPAVGAETRKGSKLECIGLIEQLRFEGGPSGPIGFRVYVSRGVAANVLNHFGNPLDSLRLKLAWHVFDFDEGRNCWFDAAHLKSPETAEALSDTRDGAPRLFMDNQPTVLSDTVDMKFFRFEFQVVPAPKKSTTLEFATRSQERRITRWGTAS